ncbi:SCO family protein [Achromobacter aloeverae]|uniref:SCO family protein n=1 Tax=Achromobacter aloeverae TaxID=1750518 RepID=A0A4Q1HQI3_9BURK|nr:SCO family protein [Achromobacter aloeverae]RXN92305.1 SCO family protein [Achromobacter aloeverae]
MSTVRWLPILLLCLGAAAPAASRSDVSPEAHVAEFAFRQHPGQLLPRVRGMRDEQGRDVGLSDYLGRRPVVFILGYYRCPVLCSTLMDAVLQALQTVDIPHEVVAVSIDPAETPTDADRKYAYYASLMPPGGGDRLHLLTASAPAISALTNAAGFPYRRDPETGQYLHPAGFLVLTPQGRISRYLPGIGQSARDIRLALVEASGGMVGGLADQLVLLCSHYDPRTGRYSVAAMTMARAVGLGTLGLLVAGLWLSRRRRRAGRTS